MGREIRMVPLDFDWPLNKVWEGFLNPHYVECPDCKNGSTPARERLEDLVSLLMLSGDDSLRQKNHPYFVHNIALGHNVIPSPDMADLTEGLAGRRSRLPFGHDAIDRWNAVDKIVAAAGLDPKVWGVCQTCGGECIHPDHKEAFEAWEEKQPPVGQGWQVWETVSEGSPISPVFKTAEECAAWVEKYEHCTPEAALAFVNQGWAPSGVMVNGEYKSGVQAADQA